MTTPLTGKRKALFVYLPAILCLALDQATKAWVRQALEVGQVIPVAEHFAIRHVFNKGAVFSILYGHVWLLALFSSIVAVAVVVYERRKRSITGFQAAALGILLGGTVGNLVDRVWFGRVTDFLDVYVGRHHWPTFNVADICINLGVALLVLGSLRHPDHPETTPEEEPR